MADVYLVRKERVGRLFYLMGMDGKHPVWSNKLEQLMEFETEEEAATMATALDGEVVRATPCSHYVVWET